MVDDKEILAVELSLPVCVVDFEEDALELIVEVAVVDGEVISH